MGGLAVRAARWGGREKGGEEDQGGGLCACVVVAVVVVVWCSAGGPVGVCKARACGVQRVGTNFALASPPNRKAVPLPPTPKPIEQSYFRPELLNRLDEVVVFKQLGEAEVRTIAALELAKTAARMQEREITLEVGGWCSCCVCVYVCCGGVKGRRLQCLRDMHGRSAASRWRCAGGETVVVGWRTQHRPDSNRCWVHRRWSPSVPASLQTHPGPPPALPFSLARSPTACCPRLCPRGTARSTERARCAAP